MAIFRLVQATDDGRKLLQNTRKRASSYTVYNPDTCSEPNVCDARKLAHTRRWTSIPTKVDGKHEEVARIL